MHKRNRSSSGAVPQRTLVSVNNLRNEITEWQNFGYFTLFNVRASQNCYYDINILLLREPSIEVANLLNYWN